MAIETDGGSAPMPEDFDGVSCGGPAWWRGFQRWIANQREGDENRMMMFESFLVGAAQAWWNTYTDVTRPKTIAAAKSALCIKYPASKNDESIWPEDEDAHDTFLKFVRAGMDEKSILTATESSYRDARGREKKRPVLYCQDWVRQAFELSEDIPNARCDAVVKGSLLRSHLPRAIKKYVDIRSRTILEVVQDVMKLDPEELKADIEMARTLAMLQNRTHSRINDANVAASSLSFRPTAYYTMPSTGNDTNAQSPNAGSGGKGPAVRGAAHLLYDDTPAGRQKYNADMAKYVQTYGINGYVSSAQPYPLTPGTLAPGRGVCDECGYDGHLRADCQGKKLPEREIKFRGINSKAQRDEDRSNSRNIGSIEVYDDTPDYQGYHGDEEYEVVESLGNGEGQAKDQAWPNSQQL